MHLEAKTQNQGSIAFNLLLVKMRKFITFENSVLVLLYKAQTTIPIESGISPYITKCSWQIRMILEKCLLKGCV